MKQVYHNLTGILLILSVSLSATAAEIEQSAIVEELIEPYLIIQEGLASDDLSGAKTGAKTFREMLKADASGGPKALAEPVNAIVEAEDLAAARAAFRKLTKPLKELVEKVGIGGTEPLYLFRCPMAFNDEGGEWLQSNRNVTNPYYGEKMYRCGSVVKQIAGKATDSVEE